MPPVVAAAKVIGAVVFKVLTAKTVAGFVARTALSLAVSALTRPRQAGQAGGELAERQADVLQLSLGERPREAVFGRVCTGGSLADAFTYGPNNEWEVMVVALADHLCDALEGYYVDDEYYAFSADGVQPGRDDALQIYWRNGAFDQAALPFLTANSGGRWTANDRLAGVSYAVAAYRYDEKAWPRGRPRFLWVLRGARVYDPRLDSTVPGGSGPQRWSDPSTHQWSANAALCRYHWLRGVWQAGQLVVGPGRTEDEAPPEQVIPAANACDEAVPLRAGGTEPRYRVAAVVRDDEPWASVERRFAEAMAGEIVEAGGQIAVIGAVARPIAADFTDDDLVVGEPVQTIPRLSRAELINEVAARYVEPAQLWQEASAPLRRSLADIAADLEPRPLPLDLVYVTSQTQAQRIGEIARRRARRQYRASLSLGPAYSLLEVGDWVRWTSPRFGGPRTFEVTATSVDDRQVIGLALRETDSSVYAWTPATDEIDPSSPAYLPPGAPGPAQIADFAAVAVSIVNAQGEATPAIGAVWAPPGDPSIVAVAIELRQQGATTILARLRAEASQGAYLITGFAGTAPYEVRATPVTDPPRAVNPTAWRAVTTTGRAVVWSTVSGVGRPTDFADRTAANIAAGIQGQGALATLSFVDSLRLAAGVGPNLIVDTGFRFAAQYWTHRPAGGSSGHFFVTFNGLRVCGVELYTGLAQQFGVGQWTGGDGGRAFLLPVAAGARIEASAYVGGVNCSVAVRVREYDAGGAFIQATAVGSTAVVAAGADGGLSTYERRGGFVVCGGATRFVGIEILATGVGAPQQFVRVTLPLLRVATAGQTELTPWAPGLEAQLGADVTAANVASGIQGQGALATLNRIANGLTQLPINALNGYSVVLSPAFPLSSPAPDAIAVSAATATWPGAAQNLPAGTITGLAADTSYAVFYDLFAAVYVAVASGSTPFFTSPDRYLYLGGQRTQTSGGGYSPPPPPPPGGSVWRGPPPAALP